MTKEAKLKRALKNAAKKIAMLERTLEDMGYVQLNIVVAEGEA